jgi:hypothetical protein
LLLLLQRKQFRGRVRRKAGEFGQKAGELDDKLTCSKPIRKPLLTQVWDKLCCSIYCVSFSGWYSKPTQGDGEAFNSSW